MHRSISIDTGNREIFAAPGDAERGDMVQLWWVIHVSGKENTISFIFIWNIFLAVKEAYFVFPELKTQEESNTLTQGGRLSLCHL